MLDSDKEALNKLFPNPPLETFDQLSKFPCPFEYISKDPYSFFVDEMYHWVMMNALATAGCVLRNARRGDLAEPFYSQAGDNQFFTSYICQNEMVLGFAQTLECPMVSKGDWASELRDRLHKNLCVKLDVENSELLAGVVAQIAGNRVLITYTFKNAWRKQTFLGDPAN